MKPFDTRKEPAPIPGEGDIEDQAAAWSDVLRDGEGDAALRTAFENWLAQSPAHGKAFDNVERAWRLAHSLRGASSLMSMENETLARVAAQAGRGRRRVARHRFFAVAASLVVVILGGLFATGGSWDQLMYLQERARYALVGDTLYRTAVGERLAVTLDDSSVLTLNTGSRAVVRYHEGIRGVTLLEGQALFEVAKDPHHPFVVTAGGRKVTALGTAFDVRLSGDGFEVTLIEGRVSVEPESSADARQPKESSMLRAELSPGEQLVAMADAPAPVIRKANVKRAISWRNGQVLFENDTLAFAVDEINRYGRRRLVLADQRLGALRVSGAFNTSDTAVFIDMLTVYLPVRVVEADGDRIVLGYRAE